MPYALPPVPPGGELVVVGQDNGSSNPWAAFSDGSVRKARAAASFVLRCPDGSAHSRRGWALPEPTRDSNVPELAGLLAAVEQACQAGARQLVCLVDSYQALQALSRGLAGASVRYPSVASLLALVHRFDRIEFRNIDRRHNKEADALCQAHR